MSTTSTAPAPLVVSVSLAAIEGFVLLALGILELANWDSERAAMNVTTTITFVGIAVALLVCGFSVWRGSAIGRATIVMFQLIALPIAWSFRESPTTLIGIAIAVVSVITIACLLHPDSVDHLADEPH